MFDSKILANTVSFPDPQYTKLSNTNPSLSEIWAQDYITVPVVLVCVCVCGGGGGGGGEGWPFIVLGRRK